MTTDVFISHASEDKDAVARPLAEELTRRGFRVWYDEYSLRVGDSLREKIDEGLNDCTYGLVVVSPSFMAKPWPNREVNGLVALETGTGASASCRSGTAPTPRRSPSGRPRSPTSRRPRPTAGLRSWPTRSPARSAR